MLGFRIKQLPQGTELGPPDRWAAGQACPCLNVLPRCNKTAYHVSRMMGHIREDSTMKGLSQSFIHSSIHP